ncbi:MAG: glucoamylase family protein, partial [Ramlibacter sp.]
DRLEALTPYARKFLRSQPAHAEAPIRAELFGQQRFEDHGRSLARAQVVGSDDDAHRESPSFFPRLDENIAALRRAFDYTAATSRSGHYVTPAADWLLDNFHLIEAQLQQIREGVPRRYYADLPKLTVQPLRGLPRVYGIAWAYVAHTDSVLNTEMFSAFLNAYQEVSELRLSELWALPTTLRVVLLENLRRAADSIAYGKVAREMAHAAWDQVDELTDEQLDDLFALMTQHGLQRSYLTQLWQRMPTGRLDSSPALVHWIEQHCPDGPGLMVESQNAQVATNLTVSNIITTLRLIGQVEWLEVIEPLSPSLRALRQLPSFWRESELTRRQITHSMERLSRRSGKTEHDIATIVVRAALAAPGESEARQTAGYHLIGPGREALEQALGMPRHRAGGRRSWRLPAYLATIAVGTLALLFAAAHRMDGPGWPQALGLFLLAWPASEAAASFVHRLLAESLKVHVLPRLDFSAGVPPEHRVLVVMPAMLTSSASIGALAHRLQLHWLANREDNAQYALLTDWADAPSASRPADAALLREAIAKVAALNTLYPAGPGAPARFLVIHRPRVWCETQQAWLGWERKRGKLEMLVRWLATGEMQGFVPLAPGMELAAGVRYVITLDSDTGLPPGALRELVAIAAHPLNAPSVDAEARRVTGGYAILQPRVVTPLPSRRERTLYHALFAGQCGVDPYSSGVSDVYQDLFGTGNFTGKGLLHVRAVHAVLDQRLPADSILSHDLLEGSVARCGYVSDVVLVEDHPHHPGVAASRLHRWTRGDWQLLPLMRRARHYGIDALGLWKMADNLRRSLVLPACCALLVWASFTATVPLATAVLMIAGALLAGPLLGSVAGLVPTRRGIAWRHFFDAGMVQLARAVGAAGWQFSQLAVQARLLLDAVLRAAWRMVVSGRNLLEWTTAEQAQASAKSDLISFLRQDAIVCAACVLLAIAALWSPHPVAAPLLFLLWALAPVGSWAASRPGLPNVKLALGQRDKDYLEALARDTWRFFERCVGPQDNHLPPDNLQMVPEPTVAHRTSPTNIGLYLLAVTCAREFGWISTGEVITRVTATLDTIDRLPRHHGHLLNWYDTRTLETLQPAYLSTVDSGNFAGLLLTVGQACLALGRGGRDGEAAQGALAGIAERCHALYQAMDFRPLYDAKRHLFHIGLRVQENTLDASYYDLLASESRLTSFLAIAKGDVPRRHWAALGRPFLTVGTMPGLKSWSGSMFEYLMPSLLMPEPDQGLLHVSGRAAVAEQQAFGAAQQLPWGVSESAYFAQDHSLAFQYGPFGVPRLALRRTPPTDRVVAPYATLLAAMFDPREAVANLAALEQLGGRGELGLYEALDFTVSRQPQQQAFSVVETFMAHHHGMSLAALCNVLCRNAPRRWFAAAPLVEAHEALLHESTPRQIVQTADPRPPPEQDGTQQLTVFQSREVMPMTPGWKPTHLLSNGRYSVALRASGAGVSRWRGQNISRWRDDLLRDGYGTFFYLRRDGEAQVASLTATPAPGPRWRYQARFMADRVQFDAQADDLRSTVTVLVSPEDDTELRIVTLHNTSRQEIRCELVSCFEAVLADPRADEAHPAFSNLFVQTRWHPHWRALTLARRPRLHGDPTIAAAHMLASADADVISVGCTTDRRAFFGRNRGATQPAMKEQALLADGSPVNGLDPVASLRVRLHLAPGATARLCFATLAGATEADLESRIDQYLQPMHVQRAMRMAATLAQVRLRDLGLSPDENTALQDLTTALMYSTPRPGGERGAVDQRQLWRFGISGDKPIVLVRIHSADGVPLVQALLRAQPWWLFGGLPVDVVILNSEPNSYLMPLQRDILALRDRLVHSVRHSFPRNDEGGLYLLRDQETADSEKAALASLARVVLTADSRPLELQVAALRDAWSAPRAPVSQRALLAAQALPEVTGTPQGFFHAASGEFRFEMAAGQTTPRPWVNVIANPKFGFQVSECGSGYTWAVNSRLHQVTPWSNDIVRDPAGEHWLLQDLESRRMIALTPGPHASAAAQFRVRHGQGYSVFESVSGGLSLETTFFADLSQPAKVVALRVRNEGPGRRRLRALGIAEWQLGAGRGERRTVHTWKAEVGDALFAQQREARTGFGGSTAFLAVSGAVYPTQWTCDRAEFFDSSGRMVLPDVLGRAGGAVDPAGALACEFDIAPGESFSFAFVLGHAASAQEAQRLAGQWAQRDSGAALQEVKAWWAQLLGKVQVRTPDPLFDALVNHWLLYQTVSCRLWSRAGFYQAGGAFGFRDQLQDAMALALADPGRLRAQIVLNASRQFPEGDVQHWWHAPGGEGVRTHFSDDLLWLPYAAAHYAEITGDIGVLDDSVPFIDGPQIPEGAEDAYYTPQQSSQAASVYEHCARTIDRSLGVGEHGLPLMGTGDWNDGMNRVGYLGRGESVWLGWFLCTVVERFAPFALARGEAQRAQRWQEARKGWIAALHSAGWDGAWFRRAFFDNGAPLGSSANAECRIDLIAQA